MKSFQGYSKFFNLSENPFGETPDPDFYYASIQHGQALSDLNQALNQGKCFSILTGEVGTGKTLLSRILLTAVSEEANTALILYPKFTEKELLATICDEFEVPGIEGDPTVKEYVDHLNRYLIKSAEEGKRSILIIDEAQVMSVEALESIRLLTNLETKREKLLQILLVAQPELLVTLEREDLRQLTQRVGVHAVLDGIRGEELEKYIRSRLEQAGAGNFVRFDLKAIRVIEELSGGIPRRINQICEQLLTEAEAKKIRLISKALVTEVFGLEKSGFFKKWLGFDQS